MGYQGNYQGGYQPNQNQNQPENSGAMGWDDEIEGGSSSAFTLLDEGDYWFKVKLVEKGWFDGSEKMCAAPKAMVTFEIISGADTVELKENFILHENLKWKIANFYASVGLDSLRWRKGENELGRNSEPDRHLQNRSP